MNLCEKTVMLSREARRRDDYLLYVTSSCIQDQPTQLTLPSLVHPLIPASYKSKHMKHLVVLML